MYAAHSRAFTPALGLQIAPKATPYFEGTGGLYICEGSERNHVFLLTDRHVVLPLSEYRNELYAHINNSQPRHEVILLGSKAYQDALQSIMRNIGDQAILANSSKDDLKRLEEETFCVYRSQRLLEYINQNQIPSQLSQIHNSLHARGNVPECLDNTCFRTK